MNTRVPITRLRPRKSQFQHMRLVPSSTASSHETQGKSFVRYISQTGRMIDPSNNPASYHFKPQGDQPSQPSQPVAASNSHSNVTTIGDTPRFTAVTSNPNPKIEYVSTTAGGDNPGIRMRSVKFKQPPRAVGSLTGIQLSGIKSFTLPVFEGPSNPILLNEFLKKYKPSTSSHIVTGPWIFVKRDNEYPGYPISKPDSYVCEMKAREVMTDTIKRIKSYDTEPSNDNSQPIDAGSQQRLMFLQRVFRSASQELKELAVKYNYTCGGWYAHATHNQVDGIFAELSRSLIAGELGQTAAHAVKATASGLPSVPRGMHIISVILPDAWDREAHKKVLDVLVRNHGFTPIGSKPELFVQMGYGHMHNTGPDSCTFTPRDFYTKSDLLGKRYNATRGRSFTRNTILGSLPRSAVTDKTEL